MDFVTFLSRPFLSLSTLSRPARSLRFQNEKPIVGGENIECVFLCLPLVGYGSEIMGTWLLYRVCGAQIVIHSFIDIMFDAIDDEFLMNNFRYNLQMLMFLVH